MQLMPTLVLRGLCGRSSGAKLGAILCGLLWTCVDSCGLEGLSFRAVWTAVDCCGHGLEIYGSEGWGFEFSRACNTKPL